MTTTAAERRLLTLAALLEELHPEPSRVPVLARMAADRLRRSLDDHRRERHSVGFALAYTARDILQDNLTSAAWAQTPFARLSPDRSAPSPLPSLPPSALLTDDEPAGLAAYLRSVIPPDAQLLMRLVLTLGCRPDEVDELFGLAPTTAAAVLTAHLVALGVVPRSGHRGSGACWSPAWLVLAPTTGGPACPACRSCVAGLRRLGRLLALQPSEAARIAVLGEPHEPTAPVGSSSSGPIRVRPLPPHHQVPTRLPWPIAVAVVVLAVTLVPFLSAEDQRPTTPSHAVLTQASSPTMASRARAASGAPAASGARAASRAPAASMAPAGSRLSTAGRFASASRFPTSAHRSATPDSVRSPLGNAHSPLGLRVHDGRFFNHLFPQAAQTEAPASSLD